MSASQTGSHVTPVIPIMAAYQQLQLDGNTLNDVVAPSTFAQVDFVICNQIPGAFCFVYGTFARPAVRAPQYYHYIHYVGTSLRSESCLKLNNIAKNNIKSCGDAGEKPKLTYCSVQH